ncbi:MAG TPA: ATP-binding cassette domain-containing protein [Thermoanaerobaculia bacterium]|jgi:branched-chain amino acid transport system ATP-binding protein|nr:ATP-binding cassette domain-containing protein [Thermoanaerobaculia bacterium]
MIPQFGKLTSCDRELLVADGISTGYGRTEVITRASFSLERGEIVSLVGPNTAGKTTLLLAVAGVLPIWEGQLRFEGREISQSSPAEIVRDGIVLCPEKWKIFPTMSVLENLQLGDYPNHAKRGQSRENHLEEILTLFPALQNRLKQRAGTLSGGEQQMLAISKSLMSSPKLLLVDEPALGLAPQVVTKVTETIETLSNQGISVLMAEQAGGEIRIKRKRAIKVVGGRLVG